MRKIFQEYGGVVVVVIAVVALIGLVSLLMQPNGVMHQAFGDITQAFVDKSDELIGGELNGGAGGPGGSGGESGGTNEGTGGNAGSGEVATYGTAVSSSGDGYALYNGVKLPNIDTVWTDKTTYPYVMIATNGDYTYLYITTAVLSASTNDSGVVGITNASDLIACAYARQDKEWSQLAVGEAIPVGGIGMFADGLTLWSNYNILNTDGSIYLSASSPISLDGMTVIEWDGVTDGLVNAVSNFYKVSPVILDFEQVSSSIFVMSSGHVVSSAGCTDAGGVYAQGIEGQPNFMNYFSVYDLSGSASVSYSLEETGLYFVKSQTYLSLLAYTPAG